MLTALSEEWDTDLRSGDPLGWPGYADKLDEIPHESVRTGLAGPVESPYVLIEGDFDVIGGSMGLVHGEKVVRAFDRAVQRGLPVVVVTRSGGARMQEGMVSLIQMGRTAAAVERHRAAGLLSISAHRSPTTGGVFASYGSLTDLKVAEAGGTIGFAGPRVVEQTAGESTEGRSHTAETAHGAGLVDDVVDGDGLLGWVEAALGITPSPLPRRDLGSIPVADPGTDAEVTENEPEDRPGDAWAAVRAARAPRRPSGIDVAAWLTTSWVELDRGRDPALRSALATIDGRRVVVVANDRHAGGGRPSPAGFRTAQRAIALAGRLGIPIVALVDTPGADPRSESENQGIAGEIARTFASMAGVPSSTVAACVGEGGSGGALAIAAADRLLVQETSIFSVIAPEGAAAILDRDASRAPRAAERLRLTSRDLVKMGIADAVVPDDPAATADAISRALDELEHLDPDERTTGRLRRPDAATHRWLLDASPGGFVAP